MSFSKVEQGLLSEERERAKRLMAMGEMAASLAHEIRNPLGSMELYCSLLKKDLKLAPQSLELAENIHNGIRRLDRIITNCLQFSKDVVPKRKSLRDIEEVFRETLELSRSRAEQCGVSVLFEDEGEFSVSADPHLVNQAVLNLLRNAIEACESSETQQKEVVLRSDRSSAFCWRVSVLDSGPGIPEEKRELVFDPFVTTKQEGTGLGLAIVNSIATAHKGGVSICESPLGGSCVTLELPTETTE